MKNRIAQQSPITKQRHINGWSNFTTAKKSDLHPNTARLAELGVYTQRTIDRLAQAFGVDPATLVARKGGR